MNRDIERAYEPRTKLQTWAALLVALKNFDHDGTNGLTPNYPSRIQHDDEENPSQHSKETTP